MTVTLILCISIPTFAISGNLYNRSSSDGNAVITHAYCSYTNDMYGWTEAAFHYVGTNLFYYYYKVMDDVENANGVTRGSDWQYEEEYGGNLTGNETESTSGGALSEVLTNPGNYNTDVSIYVKPTRTTQYSSAVSATFSFISGTWS